MILVAAARVTAAWPLFAVPLVLAMPVVGPAGLALAAAGAVVSAAVLAARGAVPAAELALGLAAFVAAGLVVGIRTGARRREIERISGASFTDRLTGLYNYGFFVDALRRECQRAARYGSPLSLALFDLDGFKAFNDRYGHEAGNRLLAAAGAVIESSRRSADIAARYGGEEFALLVPGPVEAAVEAAERIRREVARADVPVAGAGRVACTISAGVAGYEQGAGEPGRLVEAADRALYRSKARGRNRVTLAERDAPGGALRAG